MKKALYLIFIIGVFVIAGFHINMFIKEYEATTVKHSKKDTATINNSDGGYLILLNPGGSAVENSESQSQTDQKSILITAPYDLRNARYIELDGYYTKIDYTLKETDDATVTEINLYNTKKKEKLTLEYNNAGAIYADPTISHVEDSEIPTTKITRSSKDGKVVLSKGSSYVEIPDYFNIEANDYVYNPVDFVQFTNVSNISEEEE